MNLCIDTEFTDQSVFYTVNFAWLISVFEVLWENFFLNYAHVPISGCDKANSNGKIKNIFKKYRIVPFDLALLTLHRESYSFL